MKMNALEEHHQSTEEKLGHNWGFVVKIHMVLFLFFVAVFGMMQKWEHWKQADQQDKYVQTPANSTGPTLKWTGTR
jgi:hypothetical protein